jgi:hypothetical protein
MCLVRVRASVPIWLPQKEYLAGWLDCWNVSSFLVANNVLSMRMMNVM